MRMAVDSLQPVHGDLVTVLATLRYRMQPRLAAAGLDVEWDVVNLPVLNDLSPHAVLQVQRILLEAVTNVLKHARASKLVVTVRVDHGGGSPVVRLTLSDNGVGLRDGGQPPLGQGLANMRLRAETIGARLEVAAADGGGTQVRLDWPVSAAAH
jgi:signal transduction histidine kinase